MPNALAYIMLALWPVITAVLFHKLDRERAVIWSLLAGYLLLPPPPAAFDFPLLLPFNKETIPSLAVFIAVMATRAGRVSVLPKGMVGRILCLIFVFSPVVTVATNPDPVFFGEIGLPGLGITDAIALVVRQALLLLPFLMARQVLNSASGQRQILVALLWGGLAYSLLMLVEIRLSPQLNNWIYGYYQHFFAQSIRFGGFRPVVFLYHGIWVAFFAMTALVAAVALLRMEPGRGKFYLGAALYLGLILVLSKSLGALVFAAFLLPLVLAVGRITQIRIAILIGALAIGYPVMKGFDLVPQQQMLNQAATIDPDRAASLEFRFINENTLLERAYERPVFGWGSWGRNHILDPVSGNIQTVTDGRWIIVIGVYGWLGFLAEFGLLILPLVLLWREATAARQSDISPFIAPLSLLLAINVADMIPNATITPLTWMLAGALTGYAEALKAQRLKEPAPTDHKLSWRPIL